MGPHDLNSCKYEGAKGATRSTMDLHTVWDNVAMARSPRPAGAVKQGAAEESLLPNN